MKCIKCNKEATHSICEDCAEELVNKLNYHDQLAYALVGIDTLAGEIMLLSRLEKYKAMPTQELEKLFNERLK